MAFTPVDATWFNTVPSYDETELRRADASMFAGAGDTADPLGVRGGIVLHASNSLAVTVDGSDVVTVQAGGVAIPGNNTAGNGVYRSALGASQNASLVARDATNGRIDLVVFEVITGGTQAQVRIIAGVPSGSPAVPALPTRAVELARLSVPNSGGSAATVDNSRRTFAAALGGRLTVATFSALPAASPPWQEAVALDTGYTYRWNGTAWKLRSTGGWVAWSPGGTINNTGGTYGRWCVVDGMAKAIGQVTCGGASSAGTLTINNLPIAIGESHPVGAGSPPLGVATAHNSTVTTVQGKVSASGANAITFYTDGAGNAIWTHTAPFTFGTADQLGFSIEYPV